MKSMPWLVAIVVIACVLKMLSDGVVIGSVNLGHVDASVYLAILSPILGSHSYLESKKNDSSTSS